MSTKDQRSAAIVSRAEECARSGEFTDWLGIEHHLRSLGMEEARHVLDYEVMRERLNRVCEQARAKR